MKIKPVHLVLIPLILITLQNCDYKRNKYPRIVQNMGSSWHFMQVSDQDSSQNYWKHVNLPHTAQIEPLVVTDQWQGTCWYVKEFELDTLSNKKAYLYFEGIMHEADVWLNERYVSSHKGGYLPFVLDITDYLKVTGINELKIRVKNTDNPDIPPGKPLKKLDFNYYGGIYRNVSLHITDRLHISPSIYANKPASGGYLVRFNKVNANRAEGIIKTHVRNDYAVDMKCIQVIYLKGKGKDLVIQSDEMEIAAGEAIEIIEHVSVLNPRIWSVNDPQLYDLKIELYARNKLVDEVHDKIGIRKFEVKKDGFYLNGKRTFLKGTNRHQEYPYVGYAISDEAQYRDAIKIKNAGFNFVRLSHYPHAEAFMHACDELGLIVMNCIPGWQFFGKEKFVDNAYQDIRNMIRRDRNHPCVAFWEVSLNESHMSEEFMMKANEILDEELPFKNVYSAGWIDHKSYDIFIPARQHASPPDYWNNYDKEGRKIIVAEYGDWEYYAQNAGFNQTRFADLKEDERSSRQLREYGEIRLLQQALNFQEAANSNRKGANTIGHANWVMFDYNRGYAPDIEASGIADIFRIPKFTYYFYQSQRDPTVKLDNRVASGPMVYIASYWTEESSLNVTVYSNCEEVELYLNDSLIGRDSALRNQYSTHLDYPPFQFAISQFIPGQLQAIGYIKGKEVIDHEVSTYGEAETIKLIADLEKVPLNEDYPDMVFVHAYILDANENVVMNIADSVLFEIEGEGKLIGHNPAPVKAGIASILLRTENFHKSLRISASGKGLEADNLMLRP